ncbi:RIP-like protein [Drosophila guanche]|uniref:Blast:RIP-like protein n=1 Tax=Drosophila guanche TaxID=7266 RepID=A0A3B0JUF8_DROGU|nr:RIP-like protein [Drosophila guanche]SPP85724.1 blast:RIP-like protein [Drosophila guanche]
MSSPQASPVYRTSVEQKRHAQDVAKRHRMGMPKLRDMLREKYRKRIIETRTRLIDSNRTIQLDELKDFLRTELSELEKDLELEQNLLDELLSDVNEWYALGEQHLETYVEPDEPVHQNMLCPVCLLKPLKRQETVYQCECGIQFEHTSNMEELEKLLQQQIASHETKCTQALRFFIEPSTGHLYNMCGSCDYFSSV